MPEEAAALARRTIMGFAFTVLAVMIVSHWHNTGWPLALALVVPLPTVFGIDILLDRLYPDKKPAAQ